jgi:hypothetical protein
MKIIEINISAGRTFNHPYEQFSNFRQSLQIKAVPTEDGEDGIKIIKDLQAIAEGLMEDHKNNLLAVLKKIYSAGKDRDTIPIEDLIRGEQKYWEALRKTGRQIQMDWSNS